MSARPETIIHPKEATEDYHKRFGVKFESIRCVLFISDITQATSIEQASRKEYATMEMLYRISQNAYANVLDKDASVLEELKNLNDIYYKTIQKGLDYVER